MKKRMSEPMTVKQAAARIGVTKQRVWALVNKGRIRVVDRDGQMRDKGGRFAAGGVFVDRLDVVAEAKARGR